MPWDFTTVPTSRHLRFRLTFQGVTVQPYASGASDSASQPKQLRFYLSVPAVSTLPHIPSSHSPSILPLSPGSLNSASHLKQSRFRFTVPALSTLPHNPSSYSPSIPPLSPGTLNSASQHDTDKIFFSFIADFLQGFLDLNANIIRHSCDLVFHLLRYHFVQRFAENIGVPYTIRCV